MTLEDVYKCDVCGKYDEDGVGWFHLSHTGENGDTLVLADYCSLLCLEQGVSDTIGEMRDVAGEDAPPTVKQYTEEATTDPTITVFGGPPIFGGVPWYPKHR